MDDILKSNREYAAQFGDRGKLPRAPARGIAILTCMDARIDPLRLAGLELGGAHVIRNGGGRASEDAIRSLILSHKLLGTHTWIVIHHTDCGARAITPDTVREVLGDGMDWMPLGDEEQSVRDDVETLRRHPLVPDSVEVYGCLYDVFTGTLRRIV